MTEPVDALKVGLAKYSRSEEHSDCTIICGPYHFKVHKVIIGAHSEYFRTALKANTFQEGKTGTIELKSTADSDDDEEVCDDPEIVKLMVHYFYHLDYLQAGETAADDVITIDEDTATPLPPKKPKRSAETKTTRSSTASASKPDPPQPTEPAAPKVHLIEHAKVFAMAVKYRIDGLRDLATQKFHTEVRQHWDHEGLAHAIHVIYTSTADEVTQLRELATQVLGEHHDELMEKPEIATLLRSINGLAYDLLVRGRTTNQGERMAGSNLVPCFELKAHGGNSQTAYDRCYTCQDLMQVCHVCYAGEVIRKWKCDQCRGLY